jgi:hypothetical protein
MSHENEALKSIDPQHHQQAHALASFGIPWDKIAKLQKLLPAIGAFLQAVAEQFGGDGGGSDPTAHPHGQKPSP